MKKKSLLILCLACLMVVSGCGSSKVNHEHSWKDATCTEAKICTECGEIEGEPLGHTVNFGVCSRCGAIINEELVLEIADYSKNIATINENVSSYINNANLSNQEDCFNKFTSAYKEITKVKVELESVINISKDYEELRNLRELAQNIIDSIPNQLKNSSTDNLIDFLNQYKSYLLAISDYYNEFANVISNFSEN